MSGFYVNVDVLLETQVQYQAVIHALKQNQQELQSAYQKLSTSSLKGQADTLLSSIRYLAYITEDLQALQLDIKKICNIYNDCEKSCRFIVEQLSTDVTAYARNLSAYTNAFQFDVAYPIRPAANTYFSMVDMPHEDWLVDLTIKDLLVTLEDKK